MAGAFDSTVFDQVSFETKALTQSFGGGIGHGKPKKKGRWIERDGKIIIFENNEQAEKYIQSETVKPVEKKRKKVIKKQEEVKPVEIIEKKEIARLSTVFHYKKQLYHASKIGDISGIVAIYKELQRREDEEECLLLLI